MSAATTLGELLSTVFERRVFSRKTNDTRPMPEICDALLSDVTEVSGLQLATAILAKYSAADTAGRIAFFTYLNESLDVDASAVAALASVYAHDPSPQNFKALAKASEPRRQELLRRLNQAPGATGELVRMRKNLLALLPDMPELARTDHDFVHLLRSWFNRGFLVLRQITWDSPAAVLEKIIAYEAVHQIHNWDDLRRRVLPSDRRCFAFFHPSMPDEPLIFVEVALTKGVPQSIQSVLTDQRDMLEAADADTAVFYSISNCQEGLAGISFGNSLIKQVARDLSREQPNLKAFVTLSPIPRLAKWLDKAGLSEQADDPVVLGKLAARYLLNERAKNGKPLDPVARFHLGNGAMVHAIHPTADLSENGMAQSKGAMVNYLYDLSRISQNLISFAEKNVVAAAPSVRTLAAQARKIEPVEVEKAEVKID